MKGLKTRVHPVTVVLALAVLGLAIFMRYSRKLAEQDRPMPPEVMGRMEGRPPPSYDKGLGAMIGMSPQTQGDMVLSFRPSAAASPLAMLGCFPGDVLVSVNGKPVSGVNVRQAIEELEKDGKPVSLIVDRHGQKVELKHTKMPTVPAVEEMTRSMGRSPRPPTGH
jgi:membrane-associated protease RseP (regulator of RpoE activity)